MKRMKSITIDFGDFLDTSRGTAFPSHEFPVWIGRSIDDGIEVYAKAKGLNGEIRTFSVSHETHFLRFRLIE